MSVMLGQRGHWELLSELNAHSYSPLFIASQFNSYCLNQCRLIHSFTWGTGTSVIRLSSSSLFTLKYFLVFKVSWFSFLLLPVRSHPVHHLQNLGFHIPSHVFTALSAVICNRLRSQSITWPNHLDNIGVQFVRVPGVKVLAHCCWPWRGIAKDNERCGTPLMIAMIACVVCMIYTNHIDCESVTVSVASSGQLKPSYIHIGLHTSDALSN